MIKSNMIFLRIDYIIRANDNLVGSYYIIMRASLYTSEAAFSKHQLLDL